MSELREIRAAVLWTAVAGLFLLLGWIQVGEAQAAGRCGNVESRPWCNQKLDPGRRADLLIAAMTPAERISQLGGDDPMAILDVDHTGTADGVARVGMPDIFFSDGPVGASNGLATAMPSPHALGATFDPALAREYGAVIADEVKKKGNDVLFAPTLDIMRTPLSGRSYETFGEDPFLTAELGVPWIRGAQAQGVIATAKHFAMNNQEGFGGARADEALPGNPAVALGGLVETGGRFDLDARVSQKAMREVYLKPFEAAVKRANPGAVMCAYNSVNGDFACENRDLLTRLLRRTFGFKGMVVADYGAMHDAAASIRAGTDIELWPASVYGQKSIGDLVASGALAQSEVDRPVHRYLETLFRFGAFDRAAHPDSDDLIDKRAHSNVARRVSQGSITLLKNRGLLPLDAGSLDSVAVIGAGADTFVTGGGSSNVDPFSFVSPRRAITAMLGSAKVKYDDGSDPARAAAVAAKASVALVFTPDYLTEGVDRRCLTLECPPAYGDQDGLIRAVAKANPDTAVVLETGGPVLTPWRSRVRALVEAWYPGQRGGEAIARMIFGRDDPGGRLPSSFPAAAKDIPLAGDQRLYPGIDDVVSYRDGVDVGYRSYRRRGVKPAYAFGHGLSYTRFSAGPLRVSPGRGKRIATVRTKITNRGGRAGIAVPQLYLRLPRGKSKATSKLGGFEKLRLGRHRSRGVSFPISRRDLSTFRSGAGGWRRARGCVSLMLGWSSENIIRRQTLDAGRNCRSGDKRRKGR